MYLRRQLFLTFNSTTVFCRSRPAFSSTTNSDETYLHQSRKADSSIWQRQHEKQGLNSTTCSPSRLQHHSTNKTNIIIMDEVEQDVTGFIPFYGVAQVSLSINLSWLPLKESPFYIIRLLDLWLSCSWGSGPVIILEDLPGRKIPD